MMRLPLSVLKRLEFNIFRKAQSWSPMVIRVMPSILFKRVSLKFVWLGKTAKK